MHVLGVSGRDAHAAAALVADGRVVAAATEESLAHLQDVGYAPLGGFPVLAAESVLRTAGLAPGSVDRISVVRRTGSARGRQVRLHLTDTGLLPEDALPVARALDGRPVTLVDPAEAQARQALLTLGEPDIEEALVLVLDDSDGPAAGLYRMRGHRLTRLDAGRGFAFVHAAARTLALALGTPGRSPWSEILVLGARDDQVEPPALFDGIVIWTPGPGFDVDRAALSRLLGDAAHRFPEPLASTRSVHVPLQQYRASLAHAFAHRLGTLAGRIRAHYAEPSARFLFAGSLFRHPLLADSINPDDVAPLSEGMGGAIGAALAPHWPPAFQRLPHLLLGPGFTEPDIKAAIENCRLDYVYEPDWDRLLGRISAMLEGGKLVGWFQGRMEFGGRALGARGVLADPSTPYARDNLAQLLGRHQESTGFPVSLPEESAAAVLGASVRAPHGGYHMVVPLAHRGWCATALDPGHGLTVHTVRPGVSPEFHRLLQVHAARTGVPGLINLPLRAPGDSRACTPLDALRTMFATPLDALVSGRFLLMKDYWLLRATVDTERTERTDTPLREGLSWLSAS